MEELMFNLEDIAELEKRYTKAKNEEKKTFKFKKHTWYTDYGKYMIQYLKQELNEKDN